MSLRGSTPGRAQPEAVREGRKRREEARKRLVLSFCVLRGLFFVFGPGAGIQASDARLALPA
jgi:hypothetical protein